MREQDKFENEWKGALEGTELAPPENVWSNIRAEVATDHAQKQSKRAAYWRWMAAASIALLLGISSFYAYQSALEEFEILSKQEQALLHDIALMEEENCIKEEALVLNSDQQVSLAFTSKNEKVFEDENSQEIVKDNVEIAVVNVPQNIETLSNANEVIKTIDDQSDNGVNSPIILFRDETSSINNSLTINDNVVEDNKSIKSPLGNLIVPTSLIRLGSGLLANVQNNIEPKKVSNMMEIIKMQNGGEKNFKGMWAGLSLGGGSFESNTNRRSSSDAAALFNDNIEAFTLDGQTVKLNVQDVNRADAESPAFSYAISVDFGKQIGRRTFLQGGVEYSKYSSRATSNIVTTDSNNDVQVFLRYNNAASLDEKTLTNTETYQLTNNFQYIAVPLKLGYKLLDRKIGISLSSGVATNFFLKNTLKDKSGSSDDLEITNGQASPYKPLNFNGLIGAEISYQWNEHYQLAIVPDYRFSINGVTKIDAFVKSKPTIFFLGFRFKYILK